MTDEQIKQNAKSYADVFGRHIVDYYGVKDAFIAGAHSLDEEINGLKEMYHDMFCVLANKLESLRNPWISVKERLPESYTTVFCHGDKGNVYLCFWNGGYWCSSGHDLIAGVTITHWMSIPKLKKGK